MAEEREDGGESPELPHRYSRQLGTRGRQIAEEKEMAQWYLRCKPPYIRLGI
jgi:hypothetical protein